jgi:putative membrane protein
VASAASGIGLARLRKRRINDMRHVMAALLFAGLVATPGFAQDKASSAPPTGSDRVFVTKAARGGMAEVALGRLAVERGTSPDVKQFGQRMVDDHGKAGDELKTLAQSKNLPWPTGLDAKDRALEARLSKLSGAAFDHAYVKAMIADHRQDVSEFRIESRSGHDPDVKAWAGKTLPTLEDHLKMAESATTRSTTNKN